MTKSTKEEQNEEKIIVDVDGNIKEALDEFLDEWVLFFFPDMHPHVDRGVKPVSLQLNASVSRKNSLNCSWKRIIPLKNIAN
jgi:hypothetical protein